MHLRLSCCLVFLCLALAPQSLLAQSAAFRAQGRYYSAKEALDSNQFAAAARMARESRRFLAGKSNLRLQYLLVTALFQSGQFRSAQKEMKLFFEIDGHGKDAAGWKDREKLYQEFPQTVDQLTSDETKAMSKLIDRIDREVSARRNEILRLDAAFAQLHNEVRQPYTDLRGSAQSFELLGSPEEMSVVWKWGNAIFTTTFSLADVASYEVRQFWRSSDDPDQFTHHAVNFAFAAPIQQVAREQYIGAPDRTAQSEVTWILLPLAHGDEASAADAGAAMDRLMQAWKEFAKFR